MGTSILRIYAFRRISNHGQNCFANILKQHMYSLYLQYTILTLPVQCERLFYSLGVLFHRDTVQYCMGHVKIACCKHRLYMCGCCLLCTL